MNRVVITGIGTVNALGLDVPSYWESVKAGRSAIRPIEGFDTTRYGSKLGAEVRGFEPSKLVDPMKLRRMDRLSQMVLVASLEAVKDAGLDGGALDPARFGIVIGNGYGGTSCTEEFFEGLLLRGPSGVNPMLFPTTVPNSAASLTSIELGLKGPNCTFCQKDISAEEAFIYAAGLIRKGAADAVIAGGGEELSSVIYHAFSSLGVLSPGQGGLEGCFPFDRRRNGRVLGEGSGVLVLESMESAMARGAKIYAEVAGDAIGGCTAGISSYCEDTGAVAGTMRRAIERAGIGTQEISYISSAANSTREVDALETAAIRKCLDRRAENIPISSIRPMTGDFEGMGGLRLLTSVLSMRDGFIPPTLNLEHPDKGLDLDYVPEIGREARVENILHMGIGNGGGCACIILTTL